MKAIGLAAVLAILLAMPAKAELVHCQGYTLEELQAMPPAKQAQWVTEELATCDKTAENRAIDYTNRGVSYGFLNEYQLALDDYSQAIALDPGFGRAYAARSNIYCILEPARISEGLADIVKATSLDRDIAIWWQRMLAFLGYYKGPIDGDFGPASQDAWLKRCAAE